MTETITRDDVTRHGEIIPPAQASGRQVQTYDEHSIQVLDPLSPTGVRVVDPRPDWVCTISAGFKKVSAKNGMEYPAVERDGIIHIAAGDVEHAPGLVEALKASGGKRLTVAVCADDPYQVVAQRFVHYSATSCDIFGDGEKLTQVTAVAKANGKAATVSFRTVYAGSPEYAALVKTCKAETGFFFCLVEWDPDGNPRMVWKDGFKPYRLRFTSRNSAVSILGELIAKRKFFDSLIGIPWELKISYRDVVGPDPDKGWARHNVPVWQISIVRPGGFDIDPHWMRQVILHASKEAQILRALPAPSYTVEHALLEAPDVDLDQITEETVEQLMKAPPCDEAKWRAQFFALVDGTPLDTDEKRAWFLDRFSKAQWKDDQSRWTDSLGEFLSGSDRVPAATEEEASIMVAKADAILQEIQRRAENAQRAPRASTTSTVEPTESVGVKTEGGPAPTADEPTASHEEEGEPVTADPPLSDATDDQQPTSGTAPIIVDASERLHWLDTWASAVKGSRLDDETAAAGFIQSFTEERYPENDAMWTGDLAEFLGYATEEDKNRLIAAVDRALAEPRRTEQAARIDKKAGTEPQLATAEQQDWIKRRLEAASPEIVASVGNIDYSKLSVAEVKRITSLLDGKG